MKKFRYVVVSNVELELSSSTQDMAKIYPRMYAPQTPDFGVKKIKDWRGNEIVMQLQPDSDLQLSDES